MNERNPMEMGAPKTPEKQINQDSRIITDCESSALGIFEKSKKLSYLVNGEHFETPAEVFEIMNEVREQLESAKEKLEKAYILKMKCTDRK